MGGGKRKNSHFSGRLWPDWGDTAQAATAGLGSIGQLGNGHRHRAALLARNSITSPRSLG